MEIVKFVSFVVRLGLLLALISQLKFCTLMMMVTSIEIQLHSLKIFLINYFLYKITETKKSTSTVSKNSKTASFSQYEDIPEKVINSYKNDEEIEKDL